MSGDDLTEAMFRAGAASALRKRASVQAQKAARGAVDHEHFPGVFVVTSEAAVAAGIARDWLQIADEIEGG